jgi:hypothetical protein
MWALSQVALVVDMGEAALDANAPTRKTKFSAN